MITRSQTSNQVRPSALDERSEKNGPHVSPSRVASFWGVHINTVYRDIERGRLRAFRLPGGQYRISTRDARDYGKPTRE